MVSKKFPSIMSITLLAPFILSTALAGQSYTFSWDYPQDVRGISGFRIYMNGNPVHTIMDPHVRSATINLDITGVAVQFTATALSIDGRESAPSNACMYDPKPKKPDGLVVMDLKHQ